MGCGDHPPSSPNEGGSVSAVAATIVAVVVPAPAVDSHTVPESSLKHQGRKTWNRAQERTWQARRDYSGGDRLLPSPYETVFSAAVAVAVVVVAVVVAVRGGSALNKRHPG